MVTRYMKHTYKAYLKMACRVAACFLLFFLVDGAPGQCAEKLNINVEYLENDLQYRIYIFTGVR